MNLYSPTMAMIAYLPEQIIFNILSLLPVLSLLRCKSVCKSWLSIISNPHFIQTHFNISSTKHPSLLNVALVVSFKAVTKRKQDVEQFVSIQSRERSSSILLPTQFDARSTRFIGCCNGLVCLGDYFREGICLWNPSTKRFKMLPIPNIKVNSVSCKLGFGYDSVADDYKIFRMLFSGVSCVVEVELYSVNADCWKHVEVPKEVQIVWPFMNLISVRAIHEVSYFVDFDVLVSFDLHNEVFKAYPYPDSVKDKRNLTSLDFEGSIAMIFKTVTGNGSAYSLWTLEDVCGKVSWTKKFIPEPDLVIDRVDLYLGGGQFVAQDYNVGFFLYDLTKKETKRLHFPVGDKVIMSAIKYTESLVSLAGFEPVE